MMKHTPHHTLTSVVVALCSITSGIALLFSGTPTAQASMLYDAPANSGDSVHITGVSHVQLPKLSANVATATNKPTESIYEGHVSVAGTTTATATTNALAVLPLAQEGVKLGGNQHSPVKKVVFNVPSTQMNQTVVSLRIAGVQGIHTMQGFYHGGNHLSAQGFASPTRLKLNGQLIQSFTLNNDGLMELDIPVSMLKSNGFNTLQFEAGYSLSTTNEVAYDAVSFGALSLVF
jgi:hypothetical protein